MEAKNDQHPMKGKQTPGVATLSELFLEHTDRVVIQTGAEIPEKYLAEICNGYSEEQRMANAALYAEAHNVANERGLWPREMSDRLAAAEEEIKKLREALQDLLHHGMTYENGQVHQADVEAARALLSPEKANEP